MTENKELTYFGNIPGGGTYLTPFVDLSNFQFIRYTVFATANANVTVNWSMDGLNTDLSDVEAVTAGNAITFAYDKYSKFAQIQIVGTGGSSVRLQSYLNYRASISVPINLTNLGTGAEIYVGASDGVRSILSSDSTITVTENANDIDLIIPSRAYAYMYGSNFTVATTEDVWYEIDQTTGSELSSHFTASGGRLTYTGSTKFFNIQCSLSPNKTSSNTYFIEIRKNGSSIGTHAPMESAGMVFSLLVFVISSLTSGDYISLFMKNDTGSSNINEQQMMYIITEI